MAQNKRQNKLFAAEDYTVVYESYINANFQAFDYDTIRTTMVEYVRNTYPENYNDWIESAEFVALLDVVAQFGHNLAYRVDLNTRNNFLSTATKQESVFKLAEFLGYSPRRNVPAFGEMKVVSVKTNEAVIGSEGTSLGGQDIRFETTTDVNNIDNFITVMNAVFQTSNNFGSPKKQVMLDGVSTQFYDLNNTASQIRFDISGFADGNQVSYNLISVDYDTTSQTIVEKSPDPQSSFGIYYKNDGKGLSSNDTGFFVGVKQGTLQFDDFNIENPIDNLTLDIDTDNINNSDVWVQTIDTSGNVVKSWNKVLDTNSENVIYNSFAGGVRDIFSVKTRTNNRVSIRFPDKLFGSLPVGNTRVWYRVSENSTYTVRPDDLVNKKLSINYVGIDGNTYNAVMTVQLKRSISTASSSETLDSIKENAPKAYASQDRLITSQDYNSILQSQVGGVKKIKSVNRTFAGHSRYVDFTDPTGAYSSLDVFGKDGTLAKANELNPQQSSAGESAASVFQNYIKPILQDDNFVNFYYDKVSEDFASLKQSSTPAYAPVLTTGNTFGDNAYVWNTTSSNSATATSGYLIYDNNAEIVRVGKTQSTYVELFTVGALVKFTTPTGESMWTKVISILLDGLGIDKVGEAGTASGIDSSGKGAIVLDAVIPNGSAIDIIYPSLSRKFTTRETEVITAYIKSKQKFGIKFDYIKGSWDILPSVDAIPPLTVPNYNDSTIDNSDWLIHINYQPTTNEYEINYRITEYTLSSNKVSFSNITNEKSLDQWTNKPFRDSVIITGVSNNAITELGTFYINGYEVDEDGITTSNKVYLSLIDSNNNSRPDNPDVFNEVVTQAGNNNLRFEWKHIAADNEVVDPSFTNIVDVFVLNSVYDTEYRNWLTTNQGEEPKVPSTYNLTKQFSSIKSKKAMSDTIVYKAVKYKPLFGHRASSDFKAKFRVIKLPGSNITDSDVKTRCVKAINEYFSVSNWDFGETFYFTELAAYVHKKLSGAVSSFVIVPQGPDSVFGDLFQITPNSDEMFIPDVSLNDIDIIQNITDENLRTGAQ